MAEFTKVCEQALRKLKAEKDAECLILCISEKDGVRIENGRYRGCTAATAEALEKHIMQWAAEHPEPVYPTWEEWNKAIFSKGAWPICMLNFAGEEVCHDWDRCCECLKQRIPADIAEKLGIEPIKNKGVTGK